MKTSSYLYLLLILFLASGCNSFYGNVEITGHAPGIDTGGIEIRNAKYKVMYNDNIIKGKFHIRNQTLPEAGYYYVTTSSTTEIMQIGMPPRLFEVYLEPGQYDMTINGLKMNDYPLIKSSSNIQNQLSRYHAFTDSLKDLGFMPTQIDEHVLAEYAKRHPKDEVVAHMMAGMRYDLDPVSYDRVYQKFSEKAKNTEDGKLVGERLKTLLKTLPGSMAPAIAGTTPDGKTINIPSLKKKIILVEFWYSKTNISHMMHRDINQKILPQINNTDFGIISVSLDHERDWWLSNIKYDNMTWPQVSDLKGFDSPNAANWGVTTVPTFFLIDGSGHMIQRNVMLPAVPKMVTRYLDNLTPLANEGVSPI